MNKWVEKYGKVFGIYMMGKPALVVLDPKESFILRLLLRHYLKNLSYYSLFYSQAVTQCY